MLRSLTLPAFLLFALLWAMTASAATGHPLAALQSIDTAAATAVTSTGVITVNTTDDELNIDGDCSLREAIEAVATDSTTDNCLVGDGSDTIVLPAGEYQLTLGQVSLTGTITLQGSLSDTTVLDGNHQSKVLCIDKQAIVTLRNLDIRNGISGRCAMSFAGGGIANFGTLTLDNATITSNQPGGNFDRIYDQTYSGTGGGVYSEGTTTIKNSIIAGNKVNDCSGSLSSIGSNLIQVTDNCTISGDVIHLGAHLGSLLDNGGPTLTHALEKGSSAIDAGDCIDSTGITVTVDQRGEPRPQGEGCDIGAYESPFTSTFTISNTKLPLIGR